MSAAERKPLTAAQIKRRAQFAALVRSCHAPKHQTLQHAHVVKAKPGVGAFATS
jgi:hypothetical protein